MRNFNVKTDDLIDYFSLYMNQDRPLFFGRIGGSDFDVICNYFNNKNAYNNIESCQSNIDRVKMYNGYFDFNNDINNFHNYLENMILYYKNMDDCTYATQYIIDVLNNNVIDNNYINFLNYILDDKNTISYSFIESIRPFLKSFHNWGENKKILVISPFSKSVEYQFKNKNKLFNDYKFPEFELLTYNTKITYNTIGDNKNTLNVTTNNWYEECLRMSEEIKNIDFDIALLSCASYSMYLGNFIKNDMGKKSIYLGGVLNVIFNIYGGRYRNYYEGCGLNLEYQINPFENEDIINIKGGRNVESSESINAYFGKR